MPNNLIDDAPCGFIIFNDEGVISYANATIATMLDYTKTALGERKFGSLLTIAGKIFYQTHFFPLISLHDRADEIFLTLVSSSGTEVPVLANAKRKNVQGACEIHCVLIPVHNRKKYEEELINAKRSLEQGGFKK